jgi:hypothetical protein
MYHPKHVEQFPYINKLCNIACCWIYEYIGILLGFHYILHISRIRVKSAGASVQSTTGSRGVRISGSNAGYTKFRGSVKGTGYPLHSPVSYSLPLPCVTVCHHVSNGLYSSFSVKKLLEHTTFYSLEYLFFKCVNIMNNKVGTSTNFAFGKYLFSRLDYAFPVFYCQNGGLCKLSADNITLLFCFAALRYC